MIERNAVPADETDISARDFAVALVHGGFTDFEDAVEAVVDYFADEDEQFEAIGGEADEPPHVVDEDEARELVAAVWSARLAEQRDWPATTEADRLLGVFEVLAARDIVAEPHFSCCGRCGRAEIGGLATERTRGFVFFHQQDTESAVAGGGLMLAYGGFDGGSERTAAIGREVVAALADAGLPVEWNGSPDQRIHVTPLDWRIRLDAADA